MIWTEEIANKLSEFVYHRDYIVKCVYLDDPVVKVTLLKDVNATFEKYQTHGWFGTGSHGSGYDADYSDPYSFADYIPSDFKVFKVIEQNWIEEPIK